MTPDLEDASAESLPPTETRVIVIHQRVASLALDIGQFIRDRFMRECLDDPAEVLLLLRRWEREARNACDLLGQLGLRLQIDVPLDQDRVAEAIRKKADELFEAERGDRRAEGLGPMEWFIFRQSVEMRRLRFQAHDYERALDLIARGAGSSGNAHSRTSLLNFARRCLRESGSVFGQPDADERRDAI